MYNNNYNNRRKVPKIFQNISNKNILNKIKSLDKIQNLKSVKTTNYNNSNNNSKTKKNIKKYNSYNNINNINNLTYNQLYIPKDSILRILVKYYNKNEMDKTQNIIAPLRKKICNFQEKHDKTSKELEELNKETKTFINRYKLSGLLSPKNNNHFLKLGITQKTINDFDYLGYKINDIINKTNIFDKSLLLNKQYDNFLKYVSSAQNSELKNDTNYISKINDGLISKKNSELFEVNKIVYKQSKNTNENENKNKIENNNNSNNDSKISRIQLCNTFNDINKTLKIITDNNFLKENEDINNKYLIKKEKDKENIQDIKMNIKCIKNSLIELEKEKKNKQNNINNELPLLKNNAELDKDNIITKKVMNSLTPKNETSTSFKLYNLSLSTSFPEKTNNFINRDKKNKELFKNEGSEEFITKYSSYSLPLSLSNLIKNEAQDIGKKNSNIKELFRSTLKYNKKRNNNLLRYNSLINKMKINDNSVINNLRKSKIEEYNNIKNNFLQHLYNNIKLKTFNENKKDISNYLKTYKGTNIKEPNYKNGSKLYNVINDFLNKSLGYNLSDEINKIRNKTNVFDYKKNKEFKEIKKLNKRIKNLIYDFAEDILDLNNDIKI